MSDKKQELVNRMSIQELKQRVTELEDELKQLEITRGALEHKVSVAVLKKRTLKKRWIDLIHKKENLNNDFILKSFNERRELLIEQLLKQGITVTAEFETFLKGEGEEIWLNEDVIRLSSDIITRPNLSGILSGTGAVLFAGVVSLPNKKSGKLLKDLIDNNAKREEYRQEIGYTEVEAELNNVKQEYHLTSEQQKTAEEDLSYCTLIMTEKRSLLKYCFERVGQEVAAPSSRQKSIGAIPTNRNYFN